MLTGAMPAIQEGVANLRTTIQNDVASKLRTTEETIGRRLAVLRRESNTALTVTAYFISTINRFLLLTKLSLQINLIFQFTFFFILHLQYTTDPVV
jgi:hypothetical protein